MQMSHIDSIDNFKDLRSYSGLSVTDFCDKYHLNYRTFCNWAYGLRTPENGMVMDLIKDAMKLELQVESMKAICEHCKGQRNET